MITQSDSILSRLNPKIAREVETWIVNGVKVKMIKKMDDVLESEGKMNARKLFLVPIFNISELSKRVQEQAPELKNYFLKELMITVNEAETKMA